MLLETFPQDLSRREGVGVWPRFAFPVAVDFTRQDRVVVHIPEPHSLIAFVGRALQARGLGATEDLVCVARSAVFAWFSARSPCWQTQIRYQLALLSATAWQLIITVL